MTSGNTYHDITVHGQQVQLGNTYISQTDAVLQSPAAGIGFACSTLDSVNSALEAFLAPGTGFHQVKQNLQEASVSPTARLQEIETISCTLRDRVSTWTLYQSNIAGMDWKHRETKQQVLQRMQTVAKTITTILDIYETKKVDETISSGVNTDVRLKDHIAKDFSTQVRSLASALGNFTRIQLEALKAQYPIFRNASDDVLDILEIESSQRAHISPTKILKQIHVASAIARNIEQADRVLARLGASHQRYEDVTDATTNTYNWLIEGSDGKVNRKLQGGRLNAREKFTTWLESGDGLFHIVGKPGSGKSTLMKVIAKHTATRQLLSRWAGDSRLVLAKFFFWKPAGPLQNSFESFMRGILFDVIRTAPELAEFLFPVNSVTIETGTGNSLSQIITTESVKDAFRVLTSNEVVSRSHRLCFLIDGLDECEVRDDFVLLNQFVTQLQTWCNRSTFAVKLCVSSRDLPVFQNLASEQRLWLHLHTKEDMAIFVDDRLRCNTLLPNGGPSRNDRETLAHALLERADGVFLWLHLVVGSILEGMYRGDSTKTLHKQVIRMPKGLEPLFEHLLEMIPEVHAGFAHLMLAVVMRLHGVILNEGSRGIRLDHSRRLIQSRPRSKYSLQTWSESVNQHITLSSFSLLADIWDSTDAEDKGFDYSQQVPAEALNRLDIERATIQVHAMSGGLLEVIGGQAVKFTHRSIPEFLEHTLQLKAHPLHIRNADVSSALCWLMFAEMQCFDKPKFYLFAIGPQEPRPLESTYQQYREHERFSARFLNFLLALRLDDCIPDLACAVLDKIENLANEQWRALNMSFDLSARYVDESGEESEPERPTVFDPPFPRPRRINEARPVRIEPRRPKLPTILSLACYAGIHEYHTWSLGDLSLSHKVTRDELQHIVYHVGLGILDIGSSQNDVTAEAVLSKQVPMLPGQLFRMDGIQDLDRLWIEGVLIFVCSGVRPPTSFWGLVKDLVKRGTCPRCYLVAESHRDEEQGDAWEWTVFRCYQKGGRELDLGIQYAELDGSNYYSSKDYDAERRLSMLADADTAMLTLMDMCIPSRVDRQRRRRIVFENVISFFGV